MFKWTEEALTEVSKVAAKRAATRGQSMASFLHEILMFQAELEDVCKGQDVIHSTNVLDFMKGAGY